MDVFPSMVRAILFIITRRRAVVIGLKIWETKYICQDVAQTSLPFLELITRDANLDHHLSRLTFYCIYFPDSYKTCS